MRTFLQVIHAPVFGGPHNQALRLAPALESAGWKTVVALPEEKGNARDRLSEAGLQVATLPLHRMRATLNLRLQLQTFATVSPEVRELRGLTRSLGAAAVIVTGLVNPHAALAGRLEHAGVIWQLLDTRAPVWVRVAMLPLIRGLADVVMTTGRSVAAEHPGVSTMRERLVPFYPPVDVRLFSPDAQRRSQARVDIAAPDDAFVIGMVANINPMKGHATFVDAAIELRRLRPETRFVLLGATYPQHAGYAESIRRRFARGGLKMGEDVLMVDPGHRVAELSSAFDVVWMTSPKRSEGFPTVVAEAMALGLPVVASDVGSVAELVHDGSSGWVVRPGDWHAAAGITDRLLADSELRRRVGAAARETAARECSVESSAAVHVKALELASAHAAERDR